jgi:hypothetical protein
MPQRPEEENKGPKSDIGFGRTVDGVRIKSLLKPA